MSEANDLTNRILDFLYKNEAYGWRANSTGVFDARTGRFRTAAKRGVSDIIAVYRGRMIAIEVKIGRDRMSPEQIGFLKNVEHAGGLTHIARGFDSYKEGWDNEVISERSAIGVGTTGNEQRDGCGTPISGSVKGMALPECLVG